MTTTRLEQRIFTLERKMRQLTSDIEIFIAKDKELLARLRTGQSSWRAMQRVDEAYCMPSSISSQNPYHEPSSLIGKLFQNQETGGSDSASTDQAVVSSSRSVSDENQDNENGLVGYDANTV